MRSEKPLPKPRTELRVLVHESQRARVRDALTRRQALLAGAAGLALAGCGGSTGGGGGGGGEEREQQPTVATNAPVEDRLLLANWVDYTDPANYKGYTRRVGPKVTVQGYGSNSELLAKLRAGGSRFDIIAPTGGTLKTMIDQGLVQRLNRELIPNMGNIPPAFTKTSFDPGNAHSVPKDYGITSFYWLTDKVSEQPRTMQEAFELLRTPKLRSLRVNFLEGASQIPPIALKALGLSGNSDKPADYDRARDLLLAVKPNVDSINSTFIERASRGDIDFGLGWNGDVRRAITALAERDREMVFLVPEDSTEYWVDNWAIPKDAEHPVAAHKWINEMLDPAVAGREMNYHEYPVPVKGIKGVRRELVEDPIIMIPDETIQRYESFVTTPEIARLQEQVYSEFKAAT